MIAPNLPSSFEMFPNIAALDKILLTPLDGEKQRNVQRLLEQLPFYMRGACEAFDRLLLIREIAGVEFRKLKSPGAKWVITGDLADAMTFAVEACLSYLRRAADALLLYVARCPKNLTLPSSMNDAIKAFRKGATRECDEQVVSLLLEYWDRIGSRIKGYRDQAAHFAIGVSDGVMFYHQPSGAVGLRLLLPDDPMATSPKAMTYEPGVQTVSFLTDALHDTTRYFNTVLERLIDLAAPGDASARESQLIYIALRGGRPLSAEMDFTLGEPVPFGVGANSVVASGCRELATPTQT